MKRQVFEILESFNACNEAIEMSRQYRDDFERAWNEWPRGDHLLWIYRRSSNYDFQKLILVKGHCANTVRHLMKDERSKKAVDVAIDFGNGSASRDELDAAYAAAADAADAADSYAAESAADAADAADTAYAAYVAYAAAAAAADAADDVDARNKAREENQKLTADICRKYLPIPDCKNYKLPKQSASCLSR